jgi:hypothetical protein
MRLNRVRVLLEAEESQGHTAPQVVCSSNDQNLWMALGEVT